MVEYIIVNINLKLIFTLHNDWTYHIFIILIRVFNYINIENVREWTRERIDFDM